MSTKINTDLILCNYLFVSFIQKNNIIEYLDDDNINDFVDFHHRILCKEDFNLKNYFEYVRIRSLFFIDKCTNYYLDYYYYLKRLLREFNTKEVLIDD